MAARKQVMLELLVRVAPSPLAQSWGPVVITPVWFNAALDRYMDDLIDNSFILVHKLELMFL